MDNPDDPNKSFSNFLIQTPFTADTSFSALSLMKQTHGSKFKELYLKKVINS